ncbi:MAG: hypothetical protein H7318_11040 [Oligoflexus sp.]|nr:hypothetical protein [Oligoflexus sp.]
MNAQRGVVIHSAKLAPLGEIGSIADEINNPLAIIHAQGSYENGWTWPQHFKKYTDG